MVVEISSALIERLLDAAAQAPDREICGLLFGSSTRIERGQACRNVAADPARAFEIDPAELFAALRAERAGGDRLIGHYHSHPTGLAQPSRRDAAQAYGDGAIWLILGGGVAMAWRSDEPGAFTPLALVATD